MGITGLGLVMTGGYTGKNALGIALDYPGLIRDLIWQFQALGAQGHLGPHVIVRAGRMVAQEDCRACAALAAEFAGTVLAPAFDTPPQAKTDIAGLDFFARARLPACIAAFSSGVAAAAICSRKLKGLSGRLGHARPVDCTPRNGADVLARIAAADQTRAALKTGAALMRGIARLDADEAARRGAAAICSRKFKGLFGTLGYARTVDCTQESGPQILAKIIAAYDDKARLKAEAEAALACGIAKLEAYEAALRGLIGRSSD